jgi:hypothetical protein
MSVDDDTFGRLVICTVVVVGFCLGPTVMAAETQEASPEITVTDVQVGVGETATAKIRLSSVPNGLAGFDITVTTGNNVEIVNASLNNKLRLPRANITDNGKRAVLRGVDLEKKIQSGAGQVTLATVTVRGTSSGEASLEVTVGQIDDDDGSKISPTIDNATVKIGQTTNNATPNAKPTSTDNATPNAKPTSNSDTPKAGQTSTDNATPKAGQTTGSDTTSTGTSNGGSGFSGQMPGTPTVVVIVIIVLLALVGLIWVAR